VSVTDPVYRHFRLLDAAPWIALALFVAGVAAAAVMFAWGGR
jgi:hypothetical protein